MNADELRAIQAPLKQLYRDQPDAARVPARAEGSLDPNDIAIVVEDVGGGVEHTRHVVAQIVALVSGRHISRTVATAGAGGHDGGADGHRRIVKESSAVRAGTVGPQGAAGEGQPTAGVEKPTAGLSGVRRPKWAIQS